MESGIASSEDFSHDVCREVNHFKYMVSFGKMGEFYCLRGSFDSS